MASDIDPKSMKLDLKATGLNFEGYSESKKINYQVELEFYDEIDVDNSQTNVNPRDIAFKLRKKELKEEYWPRLLKSTQKMHFLKTDFDKVRLAVSWSERWRPRKELIGYESGSMRTSKKVRPMMISPVWETWEA